MTPEAAATLEGTMAATLRGMVAEIMATEIPEKEAVVVDPADEDAQAASILLLREAHLWIYPMVWVIIYWKTPF